MKAGTGAPGHAVRHGTRFPAGSVLPPTDIASGPGRLPCAQNPASNIR